MTMINGSDYIKIKLWSWKDQCKMIDFLLSAQPRRRILNYFTEK